MPQNPLISVIMPVYNTEKYLAEAIRSVLDQTYSPIEIICIDDASTDESLEILKSFGDKITIVQREQNGGIAAGRNSGIKIATGLPAQAGEFIAFADGDDIWKPEKLYRQMQRFEHDPDLDIAFCMIQNFLSPELPADTERHFPAEPIPGKISGTFLVKKSSFDKVGLLNEEYRVGEFIDWMNRASEIGLKWSMVPEVLYLRRAHATNTTANRPAQMDYLKIARAALDRKRKQL